MGGPTSFIQCPFADKVPTKRKIKAGFTSADTAKADQSADTDGDTIVDEGKLDSVACSLLMNVLWAARLARPDLSRAVTHLATKVTEWTSTCDSMMHRLMGYIPATLHLRMIGWIGDAIDKLYPHFFADADFAWGR